MIRIYKPPQAPTVLSTKGGAQTAKDCADYDSSPGDYRAGKQFDKRSYYNTKEVKDLLVAAHHSKCCYCEKKDSSRRNLAVEHYRPKRGVRQARKQKEEYPGYYWLAYDWRNLLLACNECNSDHKQTLFPLQNPARRARSHHDDVAVEQPLFVNPEIQDPRDHIRFRNDAPVALTKVGEVTIAELRLAIRPSLREARLAKLDLISLHLGIVEFGKSRQARLPVIGDACANVFGLGRPS